MSRPMSPFTATGASLMAKSGQPLRLVLVSIAMVYPAPLRRFSRNRRTRILTKRKEIASLWIVTIEVVAVTIKVAENRCDLSREID